MKGCETLELAGEQLISRFNNNYPLLSAVEDRGRLGPFQDKTSLSKLCSVCYCHIEL